MKKLNLMCKTRTISSLRRLLSTTQILKRRHCCKLLVVGGGTSGISTAAKFSKTLYRHELMIIEPKDIHYCQSLFTFIGAGEKKLADAVKPTLQVIPENAVWIKDSVAQFCPQSNTVILNSGDIVEYEIMIIAVGMKLDIDVIKGLKEALDNYRNVSTIYSSKYVNKVFKSIKEFVSGIALFTAPNIPIKCLPDSYKICFMAEDYFKKHDKCAEADVTFATAESTLFPVKVYDDLINKIAKRKRVDVHLQTNLIEVLPERRQAIFECMAKPGNRITLEYSMLHVTPPMNAPEELKNCKDLVDASNFVNVDVHTLRHKKFPNIFALGDCSPSLKNKSHSAIGHQSYVIFQNVSSVFQGKNPNAKYDGYTACPIFTGYGKCVLAEFDFSLQPRETFPFRQDYESKAVYYFQKYIWIHFYWGVLLKGAWNGVDNLRKILHLGFIRKKKK